MHRQWIGTASSALLAIVLALMLWFVSTERDRPLVTARGLPREAPIAIEFVGLGPERAAYEPSVREVRISLRGFPDAIAELDVADDVRVLADLADAPTGSVTRTVSLRAECGRCSGAGVRVLEVDPPTTTVRIAERITETRSIYVDAPTAAPAGHVITRRSASPAQVQISGAGPAVQRVQRLVAIVQEPVLSQGTARFEDVPVVALDEDELPVPDVTVRPDRVAVELTTRRRGIEVSLRPEITGVEADGYYITGVSVEPQLLQLEGPTEVLEQVQAAGTLRVPVDVTGATGDVVRPVPVADVLPAGLSAINAPDEIVVTVKLTPLPGTVTLEEVAIVPRGLDDTLAVQSITPDRVDVLISGPRADLGRLSTADLEAYVETAGLGPGRHTLVVAVSAPSGFLPRSITPAMVDVVIVPATRPTATPAR